MHRGLAFLAAIVAVFVSAAPALAGSSSAREVEVVVTLEAPPLARAVASSRVLTSAARGARLDVRSAFGTSYLRRLEATQSTVESRLERAIPGARVRWRYGVVLNGLAVVVPATEVARLGRVPGVAGVYPSVRYRPLLDRTPGQIGAPALWGTDLSFAGQGVKIGILDQGIDPSHPFFDPEGYTMPAGFPKGQTGYTSAKVIVARSFPPKGATHPQAAKAYDSKLSDHGDLVAGVAAGNRILVPSVSRSPLSGVAPRAYLGNYKVATVPDASGTLNAYSPEMAAAIEAAVRDGMDVLNISYGQVDFEPTRDLVARAIDAAADAGVVTAVAAGNWFGQFGAGSIGAIGNAPKAISVAAATSGRSGPANVIASFSSGGPTPLARALKPDVTAPGTEVVTSVPAREGTWDAVSGTSLASPHVAGAVALLKQRHPDWTAAQLKSALMLTGDPVGSDESRAETTTLREGGGRINLVKADDPGVFAAPSSISFGPLRPGTRSPKVVRLTDAGTGAGSWTVTIDRQQSGGGVVVSAPASVQAPGRLTVTATLTASARQGSYTGFVVLAHEGTTRRIPYWLDVDAPRLGRQKVTRLARPGVYAGNTSGRPSLVATYRYPAQLSSLGGPEQVFRVRITRNVANFGVVLLGTTRVQPRIVVGSDENHLAGHAALPLNVNPNLAGYFRFTPVSGVVAPARGSYDIVFDSPSPAGAGPFRFRLWVDDRRPPVVKLADRSAASGGRLRFAVTDTGSGVDPESLLATIDGKRATVVLEGGLAVVTLPSLATGRHRVSLQVSDYQETKNSENVRILPNTRVATASFSVG